VKRTSSDRDDPESHACVQKGVIQILPFKRRHSPISSCFPVEDKVDSYEGATKDSRSVDKTPSKLAAVIGSDGLNSLLNISSLQSA
jgi:hypothetical protein